MKRNNDGSRSRTRATQTKTYPSFDRAGKPIRMTVPDDEVEEIEHTCDYECGETQYCPFEEQE